MSPTLIILAAGQGTRLRPLTNDVPKCMVPLHDKPLIEWQIQVAKQIGIQNIVVVAGHLKEKIPTEEVTVLENSRFAKTNMVETLFCAKKYFSSPLIISYGDIVYEAEVLEKLLKDQSAISVVVDQMWKSYWEKRFSDIFSDAETLKIGTDGFIQEIGQKPSGPEEIQAQYIGLMAFRGTGITALTDIYQEEQVAYKQGLTKICSQRNLAQLYMTDLLQGLINKGLKLTPVRIDGKWLEIDSLSDLDLAKSFFKPNHDSLVISRT